MTPLALQLQLVGLAMLVSNRLFEFNMIELKLTLATFYLFGSGI
jgi:hypothetical protein